jgi:hypothetical protein
MISPSFQTWNQRLTWDCYLGREPGHGTDGEGLAGLPPAEDNPRVGQLTVLAFVAAIRDPSRIRRSRDIGAHLSLVPRRYKGQLKLKDSAFAIAKRSTMLARQQCEKRASDPKERLPAHEPLLYAIAGDDTQLAALVRELLLRDFRSSDQ